MPQSGQPVIAFLLGKPMHSTSVIGEVVERLHHRFPTILLHCPGESTDLPNALTKTKLVVQRGLSTPALNAVLKLEDAGVRFVNPGSATLACRNRADVMSFLTDAGLPVPATQRAQTWQDAVVAAQGRPVVVKREIADVGRGIHVTLTTDGRLPADAPFPGPYIVQEYIATDASVYKLYVAGTQVRGLLKPNMPALQNGEQAAPFDVDTDLTLLAIRAGSSLGLSIFGIDVLIGRDGPVLIDVNPFPGFRGVADAARIISNHIAAMAAQRR